MVGTSSFFERVRALLLLVSPCLGAAPVAVHASDAEGARRPSFSWSGLHRARYARLWNQHRPGLAGDDQALELRTALRASYELGRITLVGDLQDARAYLTDEQSGVSTAIVNTVELVQGYVAIGKIDDERGTRVQAGQFLLELGSGRLIAAEQYRNVARGFVGIMGESVSPERGKLIGFATLPMTTLPDDRDALLANRRRRDDADTDTTLLGAWWQLPWNGPSLSAEVYLYAFDESDDPGERQTPDRRLTISGLRIRRESRPTHWDFEIELVRQTGSRRASAAPSDERVLDIDAHFAHVALGYTFAGRGSPRLAVEYERGSGDSDPGDGRWERFDALYGNRRIDLAPTGIYGALGRENIVTWGVRASRALGDRADTFIAFRTLKLAAAADAFASTGVRDSTGRSGRDAGAQVDARYRHWLRPNVLRLEVGATFLSRGDFFRTAPNANRQGDPLYVYSDVTYTFGSD